MEIKRDLTKKDTTTHIVVPIVDSNNRPQYLSGAMISGNIEIYYVNGSTSSWETTSMSSSSELGSTGVYNVSIDKNDFLDIDQTYPMMIKINVSGGDPQTVVIFHEKENRDANITQINGDDTSGFNATLNLKHLHIENDSGCGIVAKGSTPDTYAEDYESHGIWASGKYGDGIRAEGVKGVAGSSENYYGSGIKATGADTAWDTVNSTTVNKAFNGVQCEGGVRGSGLGMIGGTTEGNGATIISPSQHGIEIDGQSGDGVQIKGTATGLSIKGGNPGYASVMLDAYRAIDFVNTGTSANSPDDFKAGPSDVSGTDVNITSVAGTSVSGVSDFQNDLTEPISSNITQVSGSAVSGVDDFKAESVDIVSELKSAIFDENADQSIQHNFQFIVQKLNTFLDGKLVYDKNANTMAYYDLDENQRYKVQLQTDPATNTETRNKSS